MGVAQLPKVAMLLLLRKKTREKAGNAQNVLPVRALSVTWLCHFRSKGPTRTDIAQLPVAHVHNILPIPVTDVTSLPLGRGRRREHHKNTSKWSHDLRSLRVLRNFRLRMRTSNGTPKWVKWHSVTSGSHVTTTKKKCGKKSGMRRTYFRSGPLLDMATSGQCLFRSCDFVTSGQKATLRGIWHNFLLCMRRTHFRTMTDVTSGHVTDITSGHVTSDHLTSGHAQWSDPPHDPPQIWFCPYPYTTHLPLQSVVCFVLQFLVLSQDY
jgi:hypothetical protein